MYNLGEETMAKCTAPIHGHRTASGRANCPVCGSRSRGYDYGSYQSRQLSPFVSKGTSSTPTHQIKVKAKWASAGSSVLYTSAEIRALTPLRENIVKRAELPDLRDIFLCHAWDDRKNAAKELHDMLESKNVSVWFSEKDVVLGTSLLREIDKGLAKSRIGIVLVTPSFLERVQGEGIADKELSVLLAQDLLIPIVYNTTFENLREVSPMLASRSGLNISEDSMINVVDKIVELVTT